jgi:hypothetical protein
VHGLHVPLKVPSLLRLEGALLAALALEGALVPCYVTTFVDHNLVLRDHLLLPRLEVALWFPAVVPSVIADDVLSMRPISDAVLLEVADLLRSK